jgi:hypothetical protein
MPTLPIIGLDTSGINELEDDGARSEPIMQALKCGFSVRLLGMSADEIVSVPVEKAVRREALLARCQRLLASGQCIWPPHYILELLIAAHFRNPAQFDWRRVDVRAKVYEDAIIRRDFSNNLCEQQRKEQFRAQEEYEKMWKRPKPHLDAIRTDNPSKWPATFHDTFPILRGGRNGLLWSFGRALYGRVTNSKPSKSQIKAFVDACPPFRAAVYGLCLSWYDRCIRLPGMEPTFEAGRNDIMMAAYLPYCGRFVTADWPQERCLREVALASGVECDVLSYAQFNSSFTLAA